MSGPGVDAKGRTTILKLNYRNTREILEFAYSFASHYFNPQSADDDHIPLIEPEAAGISGPLPVARQFDCFIDELTYSVECLKKWHQQGAAWSDMALLYVSAKQGFSIAGALSDQSIPHTWLGTKQYKSAYDPGIDQVTVLTMHSSKGLEFSRVIMLGVGQLAETEARKQQNARLLYVGMTRAQECLLMTTSNDNEFSRRMLMAGVN